MRNETIQSEADEKMPPAVTPEALGQNTVRERFSNIAAGPTSKKPANDTEPDYDASLAFLRRFHPDRRWVLTAISLDKKSIDTATFRKSAEAECRRWLERQGATRNVYFSVGEVSNDVRKKAERTDIAAVHWLHVDIDPRAGEDIEQEQRRALALLKSPPGGLPEPTVITFSGGGYQAFWKLQEPVKIDSKLELAEDAKLYNLGIEVLLGADNVHNIDRIMRLPGTVNRPDEKKLKKGRTACRAELVEFRDERAYEIAQFEKAPAVPPAAVTPKGSVSGNVKRIESVEQLPAGVSDRAKVCIVQGHDPDQPNKFSGRSEWLHFVCCEMVRGGCTDEQIYAVITDPGFGISESVLDKGSMTAKYALRQIERARNVAGEDGVSLINRNYFAALEGKRIIFYREEEDKTITGMNAEAFNFATAPLKVTMKTRDAKGKPKEVELPAAKLWRESERRRYYGKGFVLDPTHSHGDDEYNLWKGFGVDPRPGDWSRMREHIEKVLAAGNPRHADYIIKWAAWTFQNPATPPCVALVFRGDEGTGKGVFGRMLVKAFGTHGQRVQNIGHVAGRFNAHMRHCCMFFADEVTLVNDEQEGNLKGMITEPTLPIEAKGVDIVQAENHLHVVMASNRDFIVPAGIGARRFAMFDVPSTHKGDTAYWAALYAETDENGGLAAMLHDLLRLDLGSWHPEAARPDTQALNDQKLRGLPPLQQHWLQCLQSGSLECGEESKGGQVFVPTEMLVDRMNDRLGPRSKGRITANALGTLFEKLKCVKDVNSRPRGWIVPELSEARRAWDAAFNLGIEWGGESHWQAAEFSGRAEDASRPSVM